MLPWAFRSMNCRVSSNIMEIEHHVDITHVTLETVILSFFYYETIVGSQSMTQMWRKSLVRTSTVGIAIASHVVNEHPWRPCKQPNRSFSVEPVAYHEIGNGDDHHNDPQPTSSSTSSSSPHASSTHFHHYSIIIIIIIMSPRRHHAKSSHGHSPGHRSIRLHVLVDGGSVSPLVSSVATWRNRGNPFHWPVSPRKR